MEDKINKLKNIIKEYLKALTIRNILICDRCGYTQGHQCVYCSKCGGNMKRHDIITKYDLFVISRMSIGWDSYLDTKYLYKKHTKLIDDIYNNGRFKEYDYNKLVEEICGHITETKVFYSWINSDGDIKITKTSISSRNGLSDNYNKYQILETTIVSPTSNKIQSRPCMVSNDDIVYVEDVGLYKIYNFTKFH